VWELRIHVGPGYRLYYAQIDRLVVLLLGGGDKRGQARDIRVAQIRLADFRSRRSVQ
jgi:putative addiction module killer protein